LRWHVDELFVRINGERCYLWRAVDHEGEVRYGRAKAIVTDCLPSYGAAPKALGAEDLRDQVASKRQLLT
jgi:putative transposase